MEDSADLIAKPVLGREQIKQIIPYKEPFLFIDSVLKLEKDIIVAQKAVDGSEDFFKGHFVDFKIMPGALIIEGIGQAATLLIRHNTPNHKDKDILAYKIKDAVFRVPTFPGDVLTYEVRIVMLDERFAIVKGKATVNDNIVSECLMMLAIVSKAEFRGKYNKQ